MLVSLSLILMILSEPINTFTPTNNYDIAKRKWDNSPKVDYIFEYHLFLCGLCHPCKMKPKIITVQNKVVTQVKYKYHQDNHFCQV